MKIIRATKLPIDKPGIYSGIPLEHYHSSQITPDFCVSSSGLRRAWDDGMAHFWLHCEHNPKRLPIEATKYMHLGGAAHHLMLGEDNFKSRYIARPDTYSDQKTGEEKKWTMAAGFCKQWVEKHQKAGRTVLSSDDLRRVMGMARELAIDPFVMDGALEGAVECSMIAKDKDTGLWLRGRPDVVPTSSGDFIDLKVVSDLRPVALMRSIGDYGLHMQAAVIWMLTEMLDLPFESFTLFFLENEEPFQVAKIQLYDEDLARGRRQVRAMMRRIANGRVANEWPGPFPRDNVVPLPISKGLRDAIDARLEREELAVGS